MWTRSIQPIPAAKPEIGTVTLMVRSRNSRLLISIADDGAGIDVAAVVRRARELGWIGDQDPSEEEAYAFVFRPGFSTASAVSEISGRGVGLDLVAERVAARRGSVRLVSTPGKGTRFEIEASYDNSASNPRVAGIEDQLEAPEHERSPGLPGAGYRKATAAADRPLVLAGEGIRGRRGPPNTAVTTGATGRMNIRGFHLRHLSGNMSNRQHCSSE